MIRLATIAASVALIGAPDALACRFPANGKPTAESKQIREWNAKLSTARKVTGTYTVEREVQNPDQRDAVDQMGAVIGPDGKVRASTFVELANLIVVRCAGPIIIKPNAGQTGTFYLQKREIDERWLILHFERDAPKDD